MTATLSRALIACALFSAAPALAQTEPPAPGKQVRFEKGFWSTVPQVRDGKVSQCVLVVLRPREGKNGPINTRFNMTIGRGAGFAIATSDEAMPTEIVLDDQAEIVIDSRTFPAVAFTVGPGLALHPGDAAGALAALQNAKAVTLRSAGAGTDTGAITLDLPAEAYGWLTQCGKLFDIAIDKPTDPTAPELPQPRPRSPKVSSAQATPAGPPGIEDKQKIQGWDASELRAADGTIAVCFIRRRYTTGAGPKGERILGTYFTVSKTKGLMMILKDSDLKLTNGTPIGDGTLLAGGKPFPGLTMQALGGDEISLHPRQPALLAAAIENGGRFDFKSKALRMEFPVQASVIQWLRACARRNGISMEAGKS